MAKLDDEIEQDAERLDEDRPERCYLCDARGPLYLDGEDWFCAQCLEMGEE